ncbi:protein SOMBRERO-like [Hibiscus syriacus]|uniref:protein SOMBRERO-like n=1 Tax=Hibiscus syriacus TaxID=106335 RepID=UPI001920D492|nr:protein SOMBRERO-like [Hibiscus syriacus]
MSSIKSKEEEAAALLSSIPPGYRFKPKDEELIEFYLKRKIKDQELPPNLFRDVKLYDHDPETLTAINNNGTSDGEVMEWYFFTPRDRKYGNGKRPSRSAGDGYWKATGKDKEVVSSEGQENGTAPLVQREEFGAGALNMPIKDQRSPDDGAIVGHGEGRVLENGMEAGFIPMPTPLTTVPLDYQSWLGVSLQQPLSGDGLSNWSHLSSMQQPLSDAGLSNWSQLAIDGAASFRCRSKYWSYLA